MTITKKKISQDLEAEFKKLLDVKPDNNVNLEEFQQELQKKKNLKQLLRKRLLRSIRETTMAIKER